MRSSLNEKLDHFFTVKKKSTHLLEPLNFPKVNDKDHNPILEVEESYPKNVQQEAAAPFKAMTFGENNNQTLVKLKNIQLKN